MARSEGMHAFLALILAVAPQGETREDFDLDELGRRVATAPQAAFGLRRCYPPDPVTSGDSTLELALLDHEGSPLASRIQLWKLDVAPTGSHPAGDQRVFLGEIPAAGLVLRGLEDGQYRVLVHEQRMFTPPPAPILVSAKRVRATREVPTGITVPVRVRVVGSDGRPLTRIEAVTASGQRGNSSLVGRARAAGWLHPRVPEVPSCREWGCCARSSGCSALVYPRGEPRNLEAEADGWFHLGEVVVATNKTYPRFLARLTLPGQRNRCVELSISYKRFEQDYFVLWPDDHVAELAAQRLTLTEAAPVEPEDLVLRGSPEHISEVHWDRPSQAAPFSAWLVSDPRVRFWGTLSELRRSSD